MSFNSIKEIENYFENQLSSKNQKNQYMPKVRYFCDYIDHKFDSNSSVENIIQFNITREIIKESALQFIIENISYRSEQSLHDYFVAISQFFKILQKSHNLNNTNVQRIFASNPDDPLSINNIKNEIIKDIEKRNEKFKSDGKLSNIIKLKPKKKYPTINDDEFEFIVKYCDETIQNYYKKGDNRSLTSYIKYQYSIIVKFILMTGIKMDKLVDLVFSEIIDDKILSLNTGDFDKNFSIELSEKLVSQFGQYIKERQRILEINNKSNDYLFVDSDGNKMDKAYKSYMKQFLDKIKKEYILHKIPGENRIEYKEKENRFTPTGLSKYIIIKFISVGTNQSIIMDLTGVSYDIYNYCQDEVNIEKLKKRNKYLNDQIQETKIMEYL